MIFIDFSLGFSGFHRFFKGFHWFRAFYGVFHVYIWCHHLSKRCSVFSSQSIFHDRVSWTSTDFIQHGSAQRSTVFPQQRKLTGSSAQNIAPVCTGAGTGSGSTRFRRRFRRFPRRFGIWCRDLLEPDLALHQRFPQNLLRDLLCNLLRDPLNLTWLCTKASQELLRNLLRNQVKFNRVPEKVPEKVPGGFGAEPGQVQQGSGEGSGEALGKPWCKAKSGSTGPGEGCREGPGEGFGGIFGAGPGQVPTGSKGFQRLVSQHVSERFVKIKRCGC